MRYSPLLLLLLASCQTWGWSETADALMPDEFTLGQGSSTGALTGDLADGYGWHDFDFDSTSESESTYAALTWDIPSIKADNGMSREAQRNFALLVDHMVEEENLDGDEEIEVEDTAMIGPVSLNLRPGASLPSKEVLLAILGAALLVGLLLRYKARAARRRW